MYDATLGRFLQRDTVEPTSENLNLYEYCYDSPPDCADPSGEQARAETWWRDVCKLDAAPAGYTVHHLYDENKSEVWNKCKISWDDATNKCAVLANINSSLGPLTRKILPNEKGDTRASCDKLKETWDKVIECEKKVYGAYMFCNKAELLKKCELRENATDKQIKKCCCKLATKGSAEYNEKVEAANPLPQLQEEFEKCLKSKGVIK